MFKHRVPLKRWVEYLFLRAKVLEYIPLYHLHTPPFQREFLTQGTWQYEDKSCDTCMSYYTIHTFMENGDYSRSLKVLSGTIWTHTGNWEWLDAAQTQIRFYDLVDDSGNDVPNSIYTVISISLTEMIWEDDFEVRTTLTKI